jgi:hypothetical protein
MSLSLFSGVTNWDEVGAQMVAIAGDGMLEPQAGAYTRPLLSLQPSLKLFYLLYRHAPQLSVTFLSPATLEKQPRKRPR